MAEPMSDELLAEIRERAGRAMEHLEGDGSSVEFCVHAMPALLAEVEQLRAELAGRCDLADCEQFREWLSGEKAEADGRARQAEAERDRLAEQVTGVVRILNGLLRHADLTDDVRVEIQNALDGAEEVRDA